MPRFDGPVVNRVISIPMPATYKAGNLKFWPACTSATATISELGKFISSRQQSLFQIKLCHEDARDICELSFFRKEAEVFLVPCSRFKVVDVLHSPHMLQVAHLKQLSTGSRGWTAWNGVVPESARVEPAVKCVATEPVEPPGAKELGASVDEVRSTCLTSAPCSTCGAWIGKTRQPSMRLS
eukprot:NODE_1417_length_1343_cov_5.384046_g1404_i0.p1 GENE.NODE_1417_length_1343_cov_5.384046_g1404_i0~~NODE_1417_length_1343_cov_5.384046_g1404_i0.p1  ORF type:complete len:182 (-),score=15.55 NODE_1417_length_1343_cov_5.384046_g1404_i0:321-866(-)